MKELPYKSHTGHELTLMLEGRKPFSVFEEVIYSDSREDENSLLFLKHAEEGRFAYHEQKDMWGDTHVINGRVAIGVRLRLFALRNEAWRIEAYLLMAKASRGRPWNDSLENLLGLLLGYSEEENRIWLEHVRETHGAWGAVPAYIKVSGSDLERLRQLGLRALPIDLEERTLLLQSTIPDEKQLADAFNSSASCLLRFGIGSKFVLTLPVERLGDGRIVRFDRSFIPSINLNMKSNIEIIREVSS